MPDLLREFGARTDITLKGFGMAKQCASHFSVEG